MPPVNISSKVKRNQLRFHEEMEETAVLGVDNLTRFTNVSAKKYFLHATFLQIVRHIHSSFLGWLQHTIDVSCASLHDKPTYKEKPQHRTGGNVFKRKGRKDFYFG